MTRTNTSRGFTLVELIVATALFSVVMLVSVGALLALVGANRKVQSLQSVMDNLNITLDGMERSIRMGSNFHCGGGNLQLTQDCSSTSDAATNHYAFAFEPYGNTVADQPWVYSYDPVTKRLYKSENGAAPIAITAPEVSIENLQFYVVGSDRGCTVNPCDTVQPKVVIVVKGSAGADRAKSSFHVQVTAVQRLLDL
jgi:prepilin-type N-terminal cleavage/methylation domain-containing protein